MQLELYAGLAVALDRITRTVSSSTWASSLRAARSLRFLVFIVAFQSVLFSIAGRHRLDLVGD